MRRANLMAGIMVLITSSGVCCAKAGAEDLQIGDWKLETSVDPMTDNIQASITVKDGKNEFSFQCEAAKPGSIYTVFVSSQFLGAAGGEYGRRVVMLRFGADHPLEPTWFYKDRMAFIPHDHVQTLDLMARAKSAQKLTVRAFTYDGASVDAAFSPRGANEAISKLASVCKDAG